MKKFDPQFRCLALFTLLAVALGLAGCKSDDRSMAEKWGDRQVAREVKKELARDPKYQYPDVLPVVDGGTVQLTGFVDTLEQRQRAAELAAHAKGAQEIINVISLKPTPTGPRQARILGTNAPAPEATQSPSASTNSTANANP